KVRGMLPRTALSLHKCRVGAKAHTARQARAREPGGARPPRRIVARLRNARTARESVDSFLPGRRDPLTETIPWALPSPEVVMPRPALKVGSQGLAPPPCQPFSSIVVRRRRRESVVFAAIL